MIRGDATDPDFWERIVPEKVRLVMLALPNHSENMFAAEQLRKSDFQGLVTATAKYDDQCEALEKEGVHAAFNIYAEAGAGFAEHVYDELNQQLNNTSEK